MTGSSLFAQRIVEAGASAFTLRTALRALRPPAAPPAPLSRVTGAELRYDGLDAAVRELDPAAV